MAAERKLDHSQQKRHLTKYSPLFNAPFFFFFLLQVIFFGFYYHLSGINIEFCCSKNNRVQFFLLKTFFLNINIMTLGWY